MRIRCEDCGVAYQHFEDHRCKTGVGRKKAIVKEAKEVSEKNKKNGIGISIHLRLDKDLLELIDRTRGDQTRPERIREILFKELM